jgi:uncharacterized protein YggE
MRFGFAVLALLPAIAGAQTVRDSTITVSATKISRIAPDRASMYVLVEGSAETAPDAVTRVETKLKAVAEAIKALGPRAEQDRAITYSVGPAAQQNMYPQQVMPPSNVSRAVLRVHMARADQVAHVAAAALGAGASGISAVTFESTVADSVRRSRMMEVLAVARADAQALATALDGKLGAIVDVSSTAGNIGFAGPTMLTFEPRFAQPTQVPEVTINTSVTVRFRLMR